jgi:hypothetical protein
MELGPVATQTMNACAALHLLHPPPLSLTITATDISTVLPFFGFIFRGTPESQSQYSQLGGHMSKEKAP